MAVNPMPMPVFNPEGRRRNPEAPNPEAPNPDAAAAVNEGTPINLLCRAVDLSNLDPSANSEVAYAVETQLKACPIFDPKTTQLTGQITPDSATGTFTFGITVTLTNMLKL